MNRKHYGQICVNAIRDAYRRDPNNYFVMSCNNFFYRNCYLTEDQILSLNRVTRTRNYNRESWENLGYR